MSCSPEDSANEHKEIDAVQEKTKELAEAVKKLSKEAERLQSNLEKMHTLQATLYQTDMKLVQWLEAGNKTTSPWKKLFHLLKRRKLHNQQACIATCHCRLWITIFCLFYQICSGTSGIMGDHF